jgi:hypothetical protein
MQLPSAEPLPFVRYSSLPEFRSCTRDAMVDLDNTVQNWYVDPDEIEFCRRPDGSDWLLGEGSFIAASQCVHYAIRISNSVCELTGLGALPPLESMAKLVIQGTCVRKWLK